MCEDRRVRTCLFIDRLSIAWVSHAYVHIDREHSAPERVDATFCSAGRRVRKGLVIGRLRSPGCFMLISISVFFSRSWREISMRACHPVQCTMRAAKGLRDSNGRLAAERRQKGREACMRSSERAGAGPSAGFSLAWVCTSVRVERALMGILEAAEGSVPTRTMRARGHQAAPPAILHFPLANSLGPSQCRVPGGSPRR